MRNYFLIFLIFLIWTNIALASDISNFVFTTDVQTVKPNEISEKITIQSQDVSGNSLNIPQTACLEIKTSSSSGEFSSSNTNWTSINILTMNKNTANRSFYYKDSLAGEYVITVSVALRPIDETRSCASWPREEWAVDWSLNQNIIISDDVEVQTSDVNDNQTSDVNNNPVSFPVEPQIFADAGGNKNGVVGADLKFFGQSHGLNSEPLDNARYIWTFGDGAKAEGKNVLHFYHYPGEYIVVLTIASGEYTASDKILVKILPNQLIIFEANKDYIKLQNDSKNDLDISSWFLEVNGKFFRFPETTLIKANTSLFISSEISKLDAGIEKPSLLYPNGSVANSYDAKSTTVVDFDDSEEDSTTVVKSNIKEKENPAYVDIGNLISNNEKNAQQVASVISVSQNDFWSLKEWMMIIGGVVILAVAGLFFVRRQGAI